MAGSRIEQISSTGSRLVGPIEDVYATTTNTGYIVKPDGAGGIHCVTPGIIFGTYWQTTVSWAESVTTSTTMVTKLTLVTPTLPIGHYRAGWCYDTKTTGTRAVESWIQMQPTAALLYDCEHFEQEYHNHRGFADIDVFISTAVTVSIAWRKERGGPGDARIKQAQLDFWRVS